MHKILFSSTNAMSCLEITYIFFCLFFFLFRNPSELSTRSSIMKFTKSVRAIGSLEFDTFHRTFLKSHERRISFQYIALLNYCRKCSFDNIHFQIYIYLNKDNKKISCKIN